MIVNEVEAQVEKQQDTKDLLHCTCNNIMSGQVHCRWLVSLQTLMDHINLTWRVHALYKTNHCLNQNDVIK
jgi:hypothetical protein